MSGQPPSSTPRARPISHSGDITIITTTRHINAQPHTPTLHTSPNTATSPTTPHHHTPTSASLPRTLSARSLPAQPGSPSQPAAASSWWTAVASTVKFLSSLAVEDESPGAPVTPKGATGTRPRKATPPVATSAAGVGAGVGNGMAATAPAQLREAYGLTRGRSGTGALPGLPRPVHVQSHSQLPGMPVPLSVAARSISVPATPQQSTASLTSSAAAPSLTPPMSPTAAPPSSLHIYHSPLPGPAGTRPSSHSHAVSALSHPSPSKRSVREEALQADSLSTSPAVPASASGHRRSASHSHIASSSLLSSASHATPPAIQAQGVTLEAYKPVQADDSADAIEAEEADRPQHREAATEKGNAEAADGSAASLAPSTDVLTVSVSTPPHTPKAANGDLQAVDRVSPSSPAPPTQSTPPSDHPRNVRLLHFQRLLNDDTLDLSALRALAWNGVPAECRADVWRVLLGYLPLAKARRSTMLEKRRQEYITFLRQHYLSLSASPAAASLDTDTLNQIQQDVPRTSPAYPFFKRPSIQKSLERVLFIFAVRHPASGYVQGMNDLVTPFYAVMLDAAVAGGAEMVLSGGREEVPGGAVSEAVLLAVEADCYWCLSSFLDAVQDHYTFAQPGIQRCVFRLSSLVQSLHPALYRHLEAEHVSFLHFAFRWMNCLLMREMSLPCTVRLFDTYIASSSSHAAQSSFAAFHVHVCVAFLLQWAPQLIAGDFQAIVLFLQRPPTHSWGVREVEALIAQAYVYQSQEDGESGVS